MKLLLAIAMLSPAALGQGATWVFLEDKGARDVAAELRALETTYDARALERRRLRRTAPGLFDPRDLALHRPYVDAVLRTGARPRTESSWLNALSVEATPEQLAAIRALPFVARTQPVGALRRAAPAPALGPPPPATGTFYGAAEDQLVQIGLVDLHAAGFTGAGVVIGVLDTGFRQTHAAFTLPGRQLDVVAEWDFVDGDPVTGPEAGDPSNQHDHGTWILGTISAYEPGTLVGGAYDASVILAKVEDVAPDTAVEEDWFVAGLQFIEANGGDVATSSLIAGNGLYGSDDDDGQTSVMTIGFNVAAENGVHCFQGAGNAGHDADPLTDSLALPADAFQVTTCGAVDATGAIAGFSSDGPTVDGRAKPEVLARGLSTHTVSSSDDTTTTTVSGTSLSTPLCAAAAACLVQAHPDWTVNQLRRALSHTADVYVATGGHDPLHVLGYGILDAEAARLETDPLVFCAPKTISGGCPPWIEFAGTPSASSPSAFDLSAHEVPNQVFGLAFYGTSGPQSTAFFGGTLCVAPPITRTAVQSSGGAVGPPDCSGSFSLDLNAVIQAGGDPGLVAGGVVHAQYWFRDPPDPFAAGLTDALRFTIQP